MLKKRNKKTKEKTNKQKQALAEGTACGHSFTKTPKPVKKETVIFNVLRIYLRKNQLNWAGSNQKWLEVQEGTFYRKKAGGKQ